MPGLEPRRASPVRRLVIARRGQAGFEPGDAVVRGFKPLFQPLDLLLLAGDHFGEIVQRALLLGSEDFQGVEAGGRV